MSQGQGSSWPLAAAPAVPTDDASAAGAAWSIDPQTLNLKIDPPLHSTSNPLTIYQSSGPKFLAIKTRKRASKAEYSKRLEQYEMDFTAQIFKHQDVDALLAQATPTDDA